MAAMAIPSVPIAQPLYRQWLAVNTNRKLVLLQLWRAGLIDSEGFKYWIGQLWPEIGGYEPNRRI